MKMMHTDIKIRVYLCPSVVKNKKQYKIYVHL